MNLIPSAFEAIKCGAKTVEVRANKDQAFDKCVTFTNTQTGEELTCYITDVRLYNSVAELLAAEGCSRVSPIYSSALSKEENIARGIEFIESIRTEYKGEHMSYGELIRRKGVYAITVLPVNHA
jgi:ASC-1-like (ASCH) protein